MCSCVYVFVTLFALPAVNLPINTQDLVMPRYANANSSGVDPHPLQPVEETGRHPAYSLTLCYVTETAPKTRQNLFHPTWRLYTKCECSVCFCAISRRALDEPNLTRAKAFKDMRFMGQRNVATPPSCQQKMTRQKQNSEHWVLAFAVEISLQLNQEITLPANRSPVRLARCMLAGVISSL